MNDGESSLAGGCRVANLSDNASSIAEAGGQANAGSQKSLLMREPTLVKLPVPVKDYSNSYPSPRPAPVKELVLNGRRSVRMRSFVMNAPVNNCSSVTIGGRPLEPPVVLDGHSTLSLYPSEVTTGTSVEKESSNGKPFEALLSPRGKAAGGEGDESWYINRSHPEEGERNALAPFLTNGANYCN